MSVDPWSLVTPIVSACSGLFGVWFGGYLAGTREAKRESDRIKIESTYLAIFVHASLNKLVNSCLQVACDEGHEDSTGAVYTQVNAPIFDPLAMDVNWKVLPANLMFEILNLPHEIDQLNNHIGGIMEFHCDPYDNGEFFLARQYGYANLGLQVFEIARRLQEYASLPMKESSEGIPIFDDMFKQQINKIDKLRADSSQYQTVYPPPIL